MSELQKQILVGGLIGLLIIAATYIGLGGKREELEALQSAIVQLEKDVATARQHKANYERLRAEVDEQNKQLEALIKLMPSELDRGEMPIRLKKMADTAGMEMESFKAGTGTPRKENYYTSYPFELRYRSGFHDFGRFASLVSGFDKMVNITGIRMKSANGSLFPVDLSCTVTAFVYNPGDSAEVVARGRKKPTSSKLGEGE